MSSSPKSAEEWADQYEADQLAYMSGVASENPDLAAYIALAVADIETQAHNAAIEEAAQEIDRWHIKRGGYTEMAHQIRNLKKGATQDADESEGGK